MNERQDIKALIDGELSPGRAAEVREAIESDPALMEEYRSMKDITQKLRSLARSPEPRGAEAVKAGIAPRRRFRWGEGLALAAVAAVLLVFVAPRLLDRQDAAEVMGFAGSESVVAKDSMNGWESKSSTMPSTDSAGEAADAFADARGVNAGLPSLSNTKGRGIAKEKPADYAGHLKSLPERSESPASAATVTPDALRVVIKTASMTVEVDDVQKAVDDATMMVRGYGGYLESSSLENGKDTKKPTGYMTIRLPQDKFEEAVSKLREYGRVESEQTSGDDVTSQVTDIDARVKTLKAEEDSYREILRSARKIGDIMDIRDRISQVRQQIESYDAQRVTLRRLAALATVAVRFQEEAKLADATQPDTWFGDTMLSATMMLKGVGKFVAQLLTYVFVLLPVWLPVALMALWFHKRAFRTEQAA